MHKKAYHDFSSKIFLSHSIETFRRGTLLCFRNFMLSKNFMDKRGVSRFSVENFRITVPKNFVEEPFLVSEKFWNRNFSCIRGGVITILRFYVVILKLKNVGKGWDSNPYLALQNPVVLPTVDARTIGISDKRHWNHETYGSREIQTRIYCFRIFCPRRTDETIYLKIEIQKYTKKRNTTLLYRMNSFFYIFKYTAKNNKTYHVSFWGSSSRKISQIVETPGARFKFSQIGDNLSKVKERLSKWNYTPAWSRLWSAWNHFLIIMAGYDQPVFVWEVNPERLLCIRRNFS